MHLTVSAMTPLRACFNSRVILSRALVALEAALELEIGDAPVELELLPVGRVYVVVDHIIAHRLAQELGPVKQRRRFSQGLGDLADLLRRIVSIAREGGLEFHPLLHAVE